MLQSHSERLMRTRKPRVHLTYEVDVGGARTEKELPFIIGVMGDFSGDPTRPLKPLRDRKFVAIDRDNFHDVLSRMKPGLKLRVQNELAADGSEIGVDLAFHTTDDFTPEHIAKQAEPMRTLLATRNKLRDLVKGLDRLSDEEFAAIRDRIAAQMQSSSTPDESGDSNNGSPD
jgi:type VI secretion system protein ImpB